MAVVVRQWLGMHSLWSHAAAPIWTRIPEKHRWTIASWLNRSKRRCWSDLVDAALKSPDQDDPCDVHTPNLMGDKALHCASICGWMHPQHEGEHACDCYCGKFRFTATEGAIERKAQWT